MSDIAGAVRAPLTPVERDRVVLALGAAAVALEMLTDAVEVLSQDRGPDPSRLHCRGAVPPQSEPVETTGREAWRYAGERASDDPPDTPTRPQEHAADAMAAKYGRSGTRRQADGSVVISGLIDDIEMEQVCIETDGRERWRA